MTGKRIEGPSARARPWREDELAADAPTLLARPSRWAALRLPDTPLLAPAEAPWTTYWCTRLDARAEAEASRSRYETAYLAFGRRGDALGQLACAAAIVEDFYVDEGALDPMDRWIAALAAHLPADAAWPSADLEARIIGCGVAIMLRDPAHPLLARWVDRGPVLLDRLEPGANRVKLATFLAQYHLWRGDFARTAEVVDATPGGDLGDLLPAEALLWLETVAVHARCAAQFERGRAAVEAALALQRRHRLQHHAYALHAHGAALALAAGDADGAQSHLDGMRPALDGRPQADQTHYWHFQAGLSLLRDDTARAIALARTALENSAEIGGPYRTATHVLSLGQALMRSGETAAALQQIDRALQLARGAEARLLVFTAALMRAACLLRLQRDDEADAALREGWGEAARRGFRTTALWRMPEAMTEVADAALARDIEVDAVRQHVRLHGLPGRDPTLAAWPWPLRLRAFGSFEAVLGDAPLASAGGKAAQRPLDLLRVVLAHGSGSLPVLTVLAWLWPQADPAAQRKTFDVALLRLRRLLGGAQLLRLEGGRLWLDPEHTWSDVSALQALAERVSAEPAAPPSQRLQWARCLLDLMRGPFLEGEGADWARLARDRHQRRLLGVVAELGAQVEPLDADVVIRLYTRALQLEPLAESLCRRLMRLHAARGERSAALRVWHSCRATLPAAGLAPARETQALATALGLQAAGA